MNNKYIFSSIASQISHALFLLMVFKTLKTQENILFSEKKKKKLTQWENEIIEQN